jgi:hypothetical protein
MGFNDDKHLDICQKIETGLKHAYESNPRLTDVLCILALDNAKVAVKQQFGFAKNESVSSAEDIQDVIRWCVDIATQRVDRVNDLSLKECVARIDKIRRSVQLHAGAGSRSYFDFIKNYLP